MGLRVWGLGFQGTSTPLKAFMRSEEGSWATSPPIWYYPTWVAPLIKGSIREVVGRSMSEVRGMLRPGFRVYSCSALRL